MITQAQLNHINTLLEDTDVLSASESKQAEACLKQLIKPYIDAPTSLTDEAAKTLAQELNRFFRIRSKVASKNKSAVIDKISTYLSEAKALTNEPLSTEEQVSAAMLQEIFLTAQQSPANAKAMTSMKNTIGEKELTSLNKTTTKEQETDTISEPVLSENVYVLACDTNTSLLNLYKHTEKNPTKDYLNQYKPLVHLAIECDATELLKILVAKQEEGVINPAVECLDGRFSHDTPIRYAAKLGKYEAVDILIAADADVNAASTTGRTALSCALDQSTLSSKTIAALLTAKHIILTKDQCKMILNLKNAEIQAPLFKNHLEMLSSMFLGGISIQEWAVENKRSDIISALIECNKINVDEK